MLLYQLTQDQKFAFLKLARNVVLADKKLDDRERATIVQLCLEMGVSTLNMTSTLNLNDLPTIFDTRRVRSLVIIELVRIATADGSLCVAEDDVINGVRKALGITLEDFRAYSQMAEKYTALLKDLNALMGP